MENEQLTLNDMVSLCNIVDAACSRGAFKANEMKSIGEVYDKLSRFIEAAKVQSQEQAASESQSQGE